MALDYVAKSAPDGYNILMANLGPNAINPAVYSKLPFDAVRDFAPVTLTTLVPQGVVVSAGFEGKTFREFLAIAKASPGKLTYATGGNGEVCVYCHTPHGADTSAVVPLWNRTLPSPASFTTYDSLGTSTLDGKTAPVEHTGAGVFKGLPSPFTRAITLP